MTKKLPKASTALKAGAQRCGATIEGPKYGRIVSWRDQCRNTTKHASGRCHLHRGPEAGA